MLIGVVRVNSVPHPVRGSIQAVISTVDRIRQDNFFFCLYKIFFMFSFIPIPILLYLPKRVYQILKKM